MEWRRGGDGVETVPRVLPVPFPFPFPFAFAIIITLSSSYSHSHFQYDLPVLGFHAAQKSPTVSPFSSMSTLSAAGTDGSPGMVLILPQSG